ncbi:hypothetical protein OO013_04210 [Mangrovivirga sp. M17]|uniref:Lipocalin-like domain-containing protein n=1 Tax=Mangrovivirga halotolerans TaxID=2993936 RepID=A0ABT3RNY0_9BACT|nr:hypothetical protein [Mangrovivirga halotolerans]MCX2743053.1 hypothetical protein [Mangrovivirga halotolerans]
MKNLINLFLTAILIVACSSSDNVVQNETPIEGKWELTKMEAQRTRTEITKEDIPYEEFYVFNSDGSFTKTRITNDEVESASGRYTKENTNDWKHLKLVYSEDSQLIDNCTGEAVEHLAIEQNELKGGSAPCDGPALYYSPVNNKD